MPYLDSVIYSLESRFSAESKQCFSLFLLYPKHMIQMNEKEYMKHVEDVKTLYNVENLEAAAATWFEMWREKQELHSGVGEDFTECSSTLICFQLSVMQFVLL